jgi:hypothetical protein
MQQQLQLQKQALLQNVFFISSRHLNINGDAEFDSLIPLICVKGANTITGVYKTYLLDCLLDDTNVIYPFVFNIEVINHKKVSFEPNFYIELNDECTRQTLLDLHNYNYSIATMGTNTYKFSPLWTRKYLYITNDIYTIDTNLSIILRNQYDKEILLR